MKTTLIVTDNLYDQVNGVVTTFKNIEQHAISDGYELIYLDPSKFSYIDCPGYPQVKLSWPRGINEKIGTINPDYIHIATEGPIGLAVRLWCGRNGVKYNTSYHTKFPEFIEHLYHIPAWVTYPYVRWFHKDSAVVLTTTRTMVDELKQHRFKGNIKPWSRGTDRSIFNESYRNKRVWPGPILLSVGRVSREKGLDDFCKISYPGAKKVVVGDGPYLDELSRKYPDVEFLGVRHGADLASYYANADVFVFTSRTDTFGVVNIEAISCGTPIAAYPVPGPIDIIDVGINGYMSEDLNLAIKMCLSLDRKRVIASSQKWTWKECWRIFKENLVK